MSVIIYIKSNNYKGTFFDMGLDAFVAPWSESTLYPSDFHSNAVRLQANQLSDSY